GRYAFAGFLPRKGAARRRMLEELSKLRFTIVLYESPRRLPETLAELIEVFGDRRAAGGRAPAEIHPEVARREPRGVAGRFAADVLGEVTLVIEGAGEARQEASEEEIQAAVARRALEGLGTRALARAVAEELGVSAREIYRRLVVGQGEGED